MISHLVYLKLHISLTEIMEPCAMYIDVIILVVQNFRAVAQKTVVCTTGATVKIPF